MLVLIFTILAVSVDAYVAGLALGQLGRRPLLKILYVSSFTLVFSALFILAFSFVSSAAVSCFKIVSACILIIIGVKNIKGGFFENRLVALPRTWKLAELSLIGMSVALDAAVASVTLSVSEGLLWIVPVLMFLGHFAFLYAGSRGAKLLSAMGAINRFSGGFLIILGLIRLF